MTQRHIQEQIYPLAVTKKRIVGQPTYTINWDVDEYTEDEQKYYKYYSHQFKPAIWDYGAIVDVIISTYYPQDKMQAIINNYLLDPNNEDSLNEFNAMQEKRAWAKQTAKELMAYAEENGIIEHFDEE